MLKSRSTAACKGVCTRRLGGCGGIVNIFIIYLDEDVESNLIDHSDVTRLITSAKITGNLNE